MWWIGDVLQNLVKKSDWAVESIAGVATTWAVVSGGQVSSFSWPNEDTKFPTSTMFYRVDSAGAGTTPRGFVSACDTITVNSGSQILSSVSVRPMSDARSYGSFVAAITPHGMIGFSVYETGIASVYAETTSAAAYLDGSFLERLVPSRNGYQRVTLPLVMRSTGAIAPLLIKASAFYSTFSEAAEAVFPLRAQVVVTSPGVRHDYLPPYISTMSITGAYSSALRGAFVEPSYLRKATRSSGAQLVTKTGAQFAYQFARSDVFEIGIDNVLSEMYSGGVATLINSYWYNNTTVVVQNPRYHYEVASGKITNDELPLAEVSPFGSSGHPHAARRGVIILETF